MAGQCLSTYRGKKQARQETKWVGVIDKSCRKTIKKDKHSSHGKLWTTSSTIAITLYKYLWIQCQPCSIPPTLCVCVYCVYKAQLDCTLNKSGPIHDRRQMYLSSFLILMNQLQNLSQTLRLTDVQCCWPIRCILGNTLFERDLHTN